MFYLIFGLIFLITVCWFILLKITYQRNLPAKIKLNGTVAKGFEPVRDLFLENFNNGLEDKAQLCVYVGDEKVVDLWASVDNDPSFTSKSLSIVFSNSKQISSIVFAKLVDLGLLNYHDKISKHWPEFAQNDKGDVTVENVMQHEAGLSFIMANMNEEAVTIAGIKKNEIGKWVEEAKQTFPELQYKTKRQYHTMTQGYIQNEIFRRLDSQGRTMGEVLRSEIAEPLGAEVHIGLRDNEFDRVTELKLSQLRTMRIFFPWRKWRDCFRLSDFSVWNNKNTMRGEMPSINAYCSANGLAKLAAVMANKGQLGNFRLMSQSTWEEMHGGLSKKHDVAHNTPGLTPSVYSRGGIIHNQIFDDDDDCVKSIKKMRNGFYGYQGLGGSVFQWNPQDKIGFGYIPSLMAWYDMHSQRGAKLQAKVTECVRNIREGKKMK